MTEGHPPTASIDELADRYDAFLLDAYGVLVHAEGAFEGAEALVDALNDRGIPFVVATNDASRLPSTAAEKYRRSGLAIETDQVVTAGELLEPWYDEHDLVGVPTAVLGTDDSKTYAERAGADLVDPLEDEFEVFILGDDAGFEFRPTVHATVTRLLQSVDRDGEVPRLVVPNPDMLFQESPDRFGIAAGSLAAMYEAILADRFPERNLEFDRLGKPYPPIYEVALDRLGTDDVVMLGDQLETDIAGAKRAGIDGALVTWGLDDPTEKLADASVRPDYLLDDLQPDSTT